MSIDDPILESTRVFVSGIPSHLTNKQLRDHFGQKFDVTDAHVFPERRIAFVGFADHDVANKAVTYFNKTFIRMSKISVNLARPFELKQDTKGQPAPASKRIGNVKDERVDSSRKRKRALADDGETIRESEGAPRTQQSIALEGNVSKGEPMRQPGKSSPGEQSENDTATLDKPPATDSDWLRGKTNRVLDLVGIDESTGDSAVDQRAPVQDDVSHEEIVNESPEALDMQEEEVEPIEISNGRLFLRNLPFSATEDDLNKYFGACGSIEEIHLNRDKKSTTSKGTAFIQFFNPDDAGRALREYDGKPFQGRLLHVLPASDKKDRKLTEFEISKLPLKKQKAMKRKAETGLGSFGWNSLYMNPDAVLASVAARLGVPKSDLLDPSSTSAAVKQAQAETSIIQETKEYLKSQGVNVAAFRLRAKDDRTLLLKNFPFGVSSEELSSMLSPYGNIRKLLFPPTGTMAVVQFEEAHSAQTAMKGLAYKNLNGSVLYLEKAPQAIFDQGKVDDESIEARSQAVQEVDHFKGKSGLTATVFVRNLNFATTSTRLKEVFGALPGFMSARVKTRQDSSKPGQILSMGFGFVEFKSKEQAQAAVTVMNNHVLDGHEVLVQISHKAVDRAEDRRNEDAAARNDLQRTKLVIKNLPFEASKKDVKSLLGAYGTLRSVRMPKKLDHSARGFAFADFITPKEAKDALEALSNTHLLGRRLVIDFAEGDAEDPEEVIKVLEKKAGRQVHLTAVDQMMAGSARKRFNADARDDDT